MEESMEGEASRVTLIEHNLLSVNCFKIALSLQQITLRDFTKHHKQTDVMLLLSVTRDYRVLVDLKA